MRSSKEKKKSNIKAKTPGAVKQPKRDVTKKGVDGRYAKEGERGYTTILNKKQTGGYALLRVYCRGVHCQRGGGSACPRRLWDEGKGSSSARAATQADLEVVQLRLEGLDGAVRQL